MPLELRTFCRIARAAVVISLFIIGSPAQAPSQSMSSQPRSLALVGGTIYPSPDEGPIEDGVVLIGGERIVAVGERSSVPLPESAETLECSGLVITAGFWNSHVHFFERKWARPAELPAAELARQLQDFLTRYGFTSVFDTGSQWENTRTIRSRIESGEVAGPRVRSTGEALIAAGAAPPEVVFNLMGLMTFPFPEIEDEVGASTAASNLLERGVDGVKLHLQAPPKPAPPFSEAAMAAAVSKAHDAGRLVFAHPNTSADVGAAARAGVDIIAHTTPQSGPWDESLLAVMKEHDVALTPTLTLWQFFMRHDRLSVQTASVDTAVGQLRDWIASNGTVLFGTDLGAVDPDPSEEYVLMERAGMSFAQILTSLTVAPARRFGEAERLGRVATGYTADLAAFEGDPADDVRALANVRYTLRDGRIIYQDGN
jgi:imidazolonepropionase-like amidohydrolase